MAEANENTNPVNTDSVDNAAAEAVAEAPKKRAPRRVRVTEPTTELAQTAADEVATPAEAPTVTAENATGDDAEKPKRATRTRSTTARSRSKAKADTEATDGAAPEQDIAPADAAAEAVDELVSSLPKRDARQSNAEREEASDVLESVIDGLEKRDGDDEGNGRGRSRTRSRGAAQRNTAKSNDSNGENGDGDESSDSAGSQSDRHDRSSRNRQRDRKRRGGGAEDVDPEILEDDVLIPVAGILDVLDNYAFVRTTGYLPGSSDIYVSLGQVKKYNLRKGDAVIGSIRQPREGENQGRQKYNALARVDSINGLTPEQNVNRAEYSQLTPINPTERLRLESDSQNLSNRLIDLVAPIGKGQRGLLVAPPRSGKTQLLQGVATALSQNNPEVHLMMLLVDERPEEVTDVQRTVKGEIIASTFERTPEDHVTIAELAIERAKRLVEMGHDVVILLDSLTRLARAYHSVASSGTRGHGDSIDGAALHAAKRFFGAARNIEDGGSLTIIATALVNPNSKLDIAILDEFRGAANAEIALSRELADKRMFPALDLKASGTMREDLLIGKDELAVNHKLRRALAQLSETEALSTVLNRLETTSSNVEFLMQIQNTSTSALQTVAASS